jgi:hypothetical protein
MNSDAGDTDMPFEIFTLRLKSTFWVLAGQNFLYDAIETINLDCCSVVVGLLFVGLLLLIKQILKLSENTKF